MKMKNFELKLIDFGNIRKKPINKERLLHFCGTKEYMAPETFENYGFTEKIDELYKDSVDLCIKKKDFNFFIP